MSEFAAPTPVKPDEPQGLGAVVEDEDGLLWIRARREHYHWRRETEDGQSPYAHWSSISAVRVLSEGVS